MSVFEEAVGSLGEALRGWHKGAVPGLLSRAAVQFDAAARAGDGRAAVGAAVARGLAGDLESARRRLHETLATEPDRAAAYVALGMLDLREADPLAYAHEAAWALVAARDLAPGVGCIERMLAQALSASGEFMAALQSARAALALDRDDVEARIWSGVLRLYFGGDVTAAAVLVDCPEEAELQGRSPAVWLAAAAGRFARAEFQDARLALRRAVAPLKVGHAPEAPLVSAARRWYREVRGFGPGVPMAGERWLGDVGGPQSEFMRTRAALAAFREAVSTHAAKAQAEGVCPRDVDGATGELEARTRRGMLEWGGRLLIRGFAEAYLPLVGYLEAPPSEVLAAMDLVVLDG